MKNGFRSGLVHASSVRYTVHEDVVVVPKYAPIQLETVVQLIVLTLLIHNYFLTLSDEVDNIWKEKARLSSLLYYAVRYLPLVSVIGQQTIPAAETCGIPVKVLSSLNVVTQGVVTAVLVLRTYALSDKKMSVLIFLGSLGTASLVLEIIQIKYNVCRVTKAQILSESEGRLSDIIRLVFEGACVAVTIVCYWRMYRALGKEVFWTWDTEQFSTYLARQGLMYFVVVFDFDLISLIFNTNIVPAPLAGLLDILPLPISSILISHFLLRLRIVHKQRSEVIELTEIRFNTPSNHHTHPCILEDLGN